MLLHYSVLLAYIHRERKKKNNFKKKKPNDENYNLHFELDAKNWTTGQTMKIYVNCSFYENVLPYHPTPPALSIAVKKWLIRWSRTNDLIRIETSTLLLNCEANPNII